MIENLDTQFVLALVYYFYTYVCSENAMYAPFGETQMASFDLLRLQIVVLFLCGLLGGGGVHPRVQEAGWLLFEPEARVFKSSLVIEYVSKIT